MKRKLLKCKKSLGWLPNEYLTEIVGFCDRGFFKITREFTFPCIFTPAGNLLLDAIENTEIEDFDLDQVRCGNCGGPVEFVVEDDEEILTRIRSKEVDMNVALRKKECETDENACQDDDWDE